MKENFRYELVITFKSNGWGKYAPIINGYFKRLRDIEPYKSIIDETVYKAFIEDKTNGKITWLKH